MSEGSAVGYVSRWAINDTDTGVLQVAAALSGVRVTYRPDNLEDYVGDNGRIEAIYWGDINTAVQVRAFKGTANVKYSEEARRSLIVVVAGADEGDTASDIEERAFNLLGEIVLAVQASQPGTPGAHLTNIRTYISDWDAEPGTLANGGAKVHAMSLDIEVTIQANVEQ